VNALAAVVIAVVAASAVTDPTSMSIALGRSPAAESLSLQSSPVLMPPPRRAEPVLHGRCALRDGAPAVMTRSRQRTWTPPRGSPSLPYNDRLEHGRDDSTTTMQRSCRPAGP
jgi:hypothetical protein